MIICSVKAQDNYIGSTEELNWTDSEAYCLSQFGTHLASIHSDDNFDDAATFVEAEGRSHWIGMSDLATEGVYQWTDGSNASYFQWDSSEPDEDLDTDCVYMKLTNGRWSDNSCSNVRPFLCNAPIASPSFDPSANPTRTPTDFPTVNPSPHLTDSPSVDPTHLQSLEPTAFPAVDPTADPSMDPTQEPTSDSSPNQDGYAVCGFCILSLNQFDK